MLRGSERGSQANRYRKVAAEYKGLSEATTDQFLRTYYLRIADDYSARVDREVRAFAAEGATCVARRRGRADTRLKRSAPRP
jgi:hypothetical protein